MAEIGMIESLANEAKSLLARGIAADEFQSYVGLIHRQTSRWSNDEVAAAYDAWIAQVSDANPARILPPFRTLQQLKDRNGRPTRPGPDRTYHRPRAEFVAAHKAFRGTLRRMGATSSALLDQHDHHQGPAGCPVCGPAGDERRKAIEEALEQLPAPVDHSTAACRCRHGWFDLPDGTVHPCGRCLRPAYEQWVDGEYTR